MIGRHFAMLCAASLSFQNCSIDPSGATSSDEITRGETNPGLAIDGGVPTTGYPAVGVMVTYFYRTDNRWGIAICTASVLCSNAIVTAAHCANHVGDSLSDGGKIGQIVRTEFRTDPDVLWILSRKKAVPQLPLPSECQNGGRFAPAPFCSVVTELNTHPDGAVGTGGANDIALGKLRSPAPAVQASLSCAMPSTTGSSVPLGIVGYGIDSDTAGPGLSGSKQSGTMNFSGLSGGMISMAPGSSGQKVNEGDSGGPIFSGGVQIGVNSYYNIITGYRYGASFLSNADWMQPWLIKMCAGSAKPSTAGAACAVGISAAPSPLNLVGVASGVVTASLTGQLKPPVAIASCPATSTNGKIETVLSWNWPALGFSGPSGTFATKKYPAAPLPINVNVSGSATISDPPGVLAKTLDLGITGTFIFKWKGTEQTVLCQVKGTDQVIFENTSTPTRTPTRTATPTRTPTRTGTVTMTTTRTSVVMPTPTRTFTVVSMPTPTRTWTVMPVPTFSIAPTNTPLPRLTFIVPPF